VLGQAHERQPARRRGSWDADTKRRKRRFEFIVECIIERYHAANASEERTRRWPRQGKEHVEDAPTFAKGSDTAC